MRKSLFVSMLAFFICGFFAAPLTADENLVRFKGGIGAIPVRGNVAPFAVNTVLGVNPGGQPWVISDLDATVKVNGDIKVDGRGLLLGGGNNIGTNAGQSVRARLFCAGVAHDSGLVPLAPNGDFKIEDILSPLPPNPCGSPVLLIVSSGGNWFAAGIPKTGESDD
jgi:hypothetical protein